MEIQKIKTILDDHGIRNYINVKGELLALDISLYKGGSIEIWIDVTNWPLSQLKRWLGY